METLPCPNAEHVHHAMEICNLARKFSFLTAWPMHMAATIALILAFLVTLAEYRLSPGRGYFLDPTIADILFLGFIVLWIFERPLRNKADRSPAMPMFRNSLSNGNRFPSAKVMIGSATAATAGLSVEEVHDAVEKLKSAGFVTGRKNESTVFANLTNLGRNVF